jgi:hypothetical protein
VWLITETLQVYNSCNLCNNNYKTNIVQEI